MSVKTIYAIALLVNGDFCKICLETYSVLLIGGPVIQGIYIRSIDVMYIKAFRHACPQLVGRDMEHKTV